ncbi:glutamine synthetase family protein [Reyranella sp.]|uniref:glutamine synthetase family protein n=1 Tax=Reyranella sp. TaxID=1929291 RepID=UPI002731390B|nr:glutamine synthetase family protein [Reyranella sp.]MDP2377009.1 glutamine synthetase family protein [Reyranella sp.]
MGSLVAGNGGQEAQRRSLVESLIQPLSMSPAFLEVSATATAERAEALSRVSERLSASDVQRLRVAWSDLHGVTRCKTLFAGAAANAMNRGVAFVSTPLLKDTSDRTAVPVFDANAVAGLPQFANAPNLILLPDPQTFVELPWSPGTAWVLGDSFHADGSVCEADPRRILARQVARLLDAGYRLKCGLEVEFHVYRLADDSRHLDPRNAAWPGPAPDVEMLHPGYRLLSEESADASHRVLELIERTAIGLKLPLTSLEVEFGPSQFEAVFDVMDASAAADAMVLFRSAVRQVLARHGYLATFVCRPPFPSVMSSGWHLHQSLVDLGGCNVFKPSAQPAGARRAGLSAIGEAWLAGLLMHARGSCVLATPTVNGYARFRPNALAPTHISWGYDDRSSLFRIVGYGDDARIENRLGEPSANPYLYMASQIIGGLEGLENDLSLAASTALLEGTSLPRNLGEALEAFQRDDTVRAQLGISMCRIIAAAKASEWARFSASADSEEFDRREYFARF